MPAFLARTEKLVGTHQPGTDTTVTGPLAQAPIKSRTRTGDVHKAGHPGRPTDREKDNDVGLPESQTSRVTRPFTSSLSAVDPPFREQAACSARPGSKAGGMPRATTISADKH
jgi:hypothetical protein